ncbi:DUF3168 domain-containing protein [Rhizobacter sp. Root1221]|uniref:tail completion protein gp17 n=1 Tax=Rhizobacter sp. Root1221 TaxID=1736433 RepID=UPI0006F21FD9|nr:DUF3168 domain-containing protein [Rhizobacter sp. Root1221]
MNRQDMLAAVVAALTPLVGGRVYARLFPQPINAAAPTWPAIRITVIDAVPSESICGDGGEDTADYRLQLDVVTDAAKGGIELSQLRSQVLTAMRALGPEFIWAAENEFDEAATKTARVSLDYVVYLSSV